MNGSGSKKNLDSIPKHLLINPELWQRLRSMDPIFVSKASHVTYLESERCFRIPVLDEVYLVFPYREAIVKEGSGINEMFLVELSLFLLHYLLGAKPVPLSGKRVTEKGLRGGDLFFRGIHALARERIIEKYGKDKDGFLRAGLRLGGVKKEGGDAAFEIYPAPKIPVTYILWMEDEEFGASLNIFFDATIESFLPLDVIYGLSIFLEERIVTD